MTRVRMLEDMKGSNDGFTTYEYLAGHEYDATTEPPMLDALAGILVMYGHAELVEAAPESAEPEAAPTRKGKGKAAPEATDEAEA